MNYNINLLFLLWLYYLNHSIINSFISNVVDKNPSLKNKLIKLLWYYIKCKTIIEKKYESLSKTINNTVNPLLLLIFEKADEQNILIVKGGEIIDKTAYMYIKKYNANSYYNMVLYEWKLPDDSKYNNYVLRFNDVNTVSDKFKTSKVNLLAVELSMKCKEHDELYAIDFKKNNYYIVDNILFDKDFLLYWCKNVLNVELSENYKVSFIDNNMELHNLKQNQSIKILRDDFEIIN